MTHCPEEAISCRLSAFSQSHPRSRSAAHASRHLRRMCCVDLERETLSCRPPCGEPTAQRSLLRSRNGIQLLVWIATTCVNICPTLARSERRQMFSTYPIVKELRIFSQASPAFPQCLPEPREYTQIFTAVKGPGTKKRKIFQKLFRPSLERRKRARDSYVLAWPPPIWAASPPLPPQKSGAERARTANLLVANQALSQLSYGPEKAVSLQPSALSPQPDRNARSPGRNVCFIDEPPGLARRFCSTPGKPFGFRQSGGAKPPRSFMGPRGLEPRTSSLSGTRSNQLSYAPGARVQPLRNSVF